MKALILSTIPFGVMFQFDLALWMAFAALMPLLLLHLCMRRSIAKTRKADVLWEKIYKEQADDVERDADLYEALLKFYRVPHDPSARKFVKRYGKMLQASWRFNARYLRGRRLLSNARLLTGYRIVAARTLGGRFDPKAHNVVSAGLKEGFDVLYDPSGNYLSDTHVASFGAGVVPKNGKSRPFGKPDLPWGMAHGSSAQA